MRAKACSGQTYLSRRHRPRDCPPYSGRRRTLSRVGVRDARVVCALHHARKGEHTLTGADTGMRIAGSHTTVVAGTEARRCGDAQRTGADHEQDILADRGARTSTQARRQRTGSHATRPSAGRHRRSPAHNHSTTDNKEMPLRLLRRRLGGGQRTHVEEVGAVQSDKVSGCGWKHENRNLESGQQELIQPNGTIIS